MQHTMKAKLRLDIINKISDHPTNESPFFCYQVKYYVDMVIPRFDIGNLWPRSHERSVAKVIYEINEPIYSYCFCVVQIGPCILKT